MIRKIAVMAVVALLIGTAAPAVAAPNRPTALSDPVAGRGGPQVPTTGLGPG